MTHYNQNSFDPILLEVGAYRDFLSAADRAWLARTTDDDVYYFLLPGAGPGKTPVQGTWADVLLACPYFCRAGMAVPPLSAVNEKLADDCYDAGMSGGVRFKPTALNARQYEKVRRDLIERGLIDIHLPREVVSVEAYRDWAIPRRSESTRPVAHQESLFQLLDQRLFRGAYGRVRRIHRALPLAATSVDQQWWMNDLVLARASLASLLERTTLPEVLLATGLCDERLGRLRQARIYLCGSVERSSGGVVRISLARLLCFTHHGGGPFDGWRLAALVLFLHRRVSGAVTRPVARDDGDGLAHKIFGECIPMEQYLTVETSGEFEAASMHFISASLRGSLHGTYESLEQVVCICPKRPG